MIKDPQQIAKQFNLTEIVAGFNHQFQHNMKIGPYYGNLTMLIYKRGLDVKIGNTLGKMDHNFLAGWIPDHNLKMTEYDFRVSINYIVNPITASIILQSMIENVAIVDLLVEKLPSGLSQVSIIRVI